MGRIIGPISEITFNTLTALKSSIKYMEENNDGGMYNVLLNRERKMYDVLFKEIF